MEEELELGFGESGNAAELSEVAPGEIVSEEEEDDFEFAFSIDSDPGSLLDVTADEIFYNGRILPAYPIFNRDLIEEAENSREEEKLADEVVQLVLEYEKRDLISRSAPATSSVLLEAANLERRRDAPANFVWAPKSVTRSPDRWRKSSSTGTSASSSMSRRWKLKDLVVGRSRSDGNERLVVIPVPEMKAKTKEKEKEKKSFKCINSLTKPAATEAEKKDKGGKGGKGETAKEMDIVTAHRIYYGKVGSGGGQPTPAGNSRRSFLPYRQELLGGLFGNVKHHF